MCQGFANVVLQDEAVKAFFARGGWVFKPSKSSGTPSQKVLYLGLIINSVEMIFEIPPDKMLRLLEGVKILLSARRFLVKSLKLGRTSPVSATGHRTYSINHVPQHLRLY